MSGNIFGDDDDNEFELTPGGDDSAPVVSRRPTPPPAARNPVAPPRQIPTQATDVQRPPTAFSRRPRTGGLPETGASALPSVRPAAKLPVRPAPATQRPVAQPVQVKPVPEPAPVYVETPAQRSEPVTSEPEYAPVAPVVEKYIETAEEQSPVEHIAPAVYEKPAAYAQEARVEVNRVDPYRPDPELEELPARSSRGGYSDSYPEHQEPASNSRYPDSDSYAKNSYPDPRRQEEPSARIAPRHEETEPSASFYDDDSEVKKSRTGKSGNSKGRASKASRDKKEKGPSLKTQFAGGRRNVLIVRAVAISLVLGSLGVGVNSVFNSPPVPTRDDVVALVRDDLKITKFDPASANAFVSSFSREYLTYTPDKTSDRLTAFKTFTTDALATKFAFTGGGAEAAQTVTEGPIITGSQAIDDVSASYEVAAKVNGAWLYFNVPVYYDEATNGFSISGTPSFTPAPMRAEPKALPAPFVNDLDLANEIEPYAESFFKAWGQSATVDLDRLVDKDANVTTKTGLQKAVVFEKLEKLTVQAKGEDDNTDPNKRLAQAEVTWTHPSNPQIAYKQTYDMKLIKVDELWYIADISGGVELVGAEIPKE